MEEKSKNKEFRANRYWRIFIPILIFLLISVPFPIRIGAGSTYYTLLFYGAIFLYILRMLYRFFQYRGKVRHFLLMLWIALLVSAWQIIDLSFLKIGPAMTGEFGGPDYHTSLPLPDYIGRYWFRPRFANEEGFCPDILLETYIGNEWIAIRWKAERGAIPCGQ